MQCSVHLPLALVRHVFAAALFLGWAAASSGTACTTAVISGRATTDGRPILWKNRDRKGSLHNEVVILTGGKYKALVIVNAGSRGSVWMGVNEAGFCIENSLSRDLALPEKTSGLGNGRLMKRALETCATVADFQQLLEGTNCTGRSTTANLGVIDAQGGAALFETGPKEYVLFDANDPQTAPNGYVVRSNFATTAHDFPPNPRPEQIGPIYSGERYLRACTLLERRVAEKISLEYVLRNMTRDLADPQGRPFPGTVNGTSGALPAVIPTDSTISRTTTVSAAVFHGVRPDEDPRLTTLWAILGDPKFSIAVPCWVATKEVADSLTDKDGGEIGEIAITLRAWSLTPERDGVSTKGLPGLWDDLWRTEDQILSETIRAKDQWSRDGVTPEALTEFHFRAAARAMTAIQKELREAKEAAVAAPTLPHRVPADCRIHDGGVPAGRFGRARAR